MRDGVNRYPLRPPKRFAKVGYPLIVDLLSEVCNFDDGDPVGIVRFHG